MRILSPRLVFSSLLLYDIQVSNALSDSQPTRASSKDGIDTANFVVPPMLRSSAGPPCEPFATWENLLELQTRGTGTKLRQIPLFVSFCRHHRDVAAARTLTNSGDSGDFLPNQLQGGAAAGPLLQSAQGQIVRAASVVPGLTARPRHDIQSSTFQHDDLQWVVRLQQQLPVVQAELAKVLQRSDKNLLPWQGLRTRKGTGWSDGTGWAHLAVVDNFRVDALVADLFPETVQIVMDAIGHRIGPRLVAIARQCAQSGIPTHCDYMNWMLTMHMPLKGPAAGSGMVVHGMRQDWCVGEAVVMDTTFPHSTYNESDEDVFLLLVDFWHPDLSIDEMDALRAFFAVNSGV